MTTTLRTRDIVECAERALRITLVRIGMRYAYYDDSMTQWYWATIADLRHATVVAAAHASDVYSHWCAETSARVVSPRTVRREGL